MNWIRQKFRGIAGIRAVPRAIELQKLSYSEEGLKTPDYTHTSFFGAPHVLLYPRSFVEKTEDIPLEKKYDYNFLGALYNKNAYEYRKWILGYAKERFTNKSFFCITNSPSAFPTDYKPIGKFDHSLDDLDKRFNPKARKEAHDFLR